MKRRTGMPLSAAALGLAPMAYKYRPIGKCSRTNHKIRRERPNVKAADRQTEYHGAAQREKSVGQVAQDLPSAGMPKRDGVERGSGAERRNEGIDLGDLDQNPVDQPHQGAETKNDQDGQRPGDAERGLKADRENMPEDDSVTDREVYLAGDHGNHRGERQKRDDRLVGDDRAKVEHGRKRVRAAC